MRMGCSRRARPTGCVAEQCAKDCPSSLMPEHPSQLQRILKPVLLIIGVLSVALGVLGIFLPLLPTTPFLLLAAVCFSRSSERMHQWLLENRWVGQYIRDYREGRGVPLRAKITALVTLWVSIGYIVLYRIPLIPVKALLVIIATAVSIHLIRLKNRQADSADPNPEA